MRSPSVDESLLRLLPPVRRARESRLYTVDGGRYLDFWRSGGRLLSGYRPEGFVKWMKNMFSVGLYGGYPSIYPARLEKFLLKRYPGYAAARLYRNAERARDILALTFPLAEIEFEKPFLPFKKARVFVPFIPCSEEIAPSALLFEEDPGVNVPGDIVAPYRGAAAVRAYHDADNFLASYNESLWAKTDRFLGSCFSRSGPFLSPRCTAREYPDFFARALGSGVLLSPDFSHPSILPGVFSEGELVLLRKGIAKT